MNERPYVVKWRIVLRPIVGDAHYEHREADFSNPQAALAYAKQVVEISYNEDVQLIHRKDKLIKEFTRETV